MSTSWHPDPGIAFWQAARDLSGGPERPGDGFPGPGPGDDDQDPPAGVPGPPLTGAGATPLFVPVRSFIQAETIQSGMITAGTVRLFPPEDGTREFWRALDDMDTRIITSVLGPPVLPPSSGTHRGQCQGCGLDDDVDIWSRCRWCAELAALRARNLPGPPLAWWWYLVPSVLGVALGLVVIWAVLYAIFY